MIYAVSGTSRTLCAGPVAVASLMTATAIQNLGIENEINYLNATIMLAFLFVIFLLLKGILKLGFLDKAYAEAIEILQNNESLLKQCAAQLAIDETFNEKNRRNKKQIVLVE